MEAFNYDNDVAHSLSYIEPGTVCSGWEGYFQVITCQASSIGFDLTMKKLNWFQKWRYLRGAK